MFTSTVLTFNCVGIRSIYIEMVIDLAEVLGSGPIRDVDDEFYYSAESSSYAPSNAPIGLAKFDTTKALSTSDA